MIDFVHELTDKVFAKWEIFPRKILNELLNMCDFFLLEIFPIGKFVI